MLYAILMICLLAVGVWLIEYLFELPTKIATVIRVVAAIVAIMILVNGLGWVRF